MTEPASEQPIPFQRMTEEALRALFFARREVSEYGSAAIEPEHLLLGIIQEGKGRAFMLLRETFRLDMRTLAREVASRLEHKPRFSTSIEVPLGTSIRDVLFAAADEAERLAHPRIGPEHLLLGILRVSDTIPASILSAHAVTLESVRACLQD